MAGHYTERAALLSLPASKKLVLMCIADSANWDNRIGFPGIDAIKQWSGLRSNSRVLEVIAELVKEGYLVRHRGGVNGRRAEFIVFPHGCCALHEPLPGYSAELPGDQDARSGRADPDPTDPGSGHPDPENQPPGSGHPDPSEAQGPIQGPAEGPAQTGPLPSSPTTETHLSTELTYPGAEQDQDDEPSPSVVEGGAASPAPWGTTEIGPGRAAFREALAALPSPPPRPPRRRPAQGSTTVPK